MHFSHIAKLTC